MEHHKSTLANMYAISAQEVFNILNKKKDAQSSFCLVDVRTIEECISGVISGAIHIPLHDFNATHAQSLTIYECVIFYCHAGIRSLTACQLFHSFVMDEKDINTTPLSLTGGILSWNRMGYPLSSYR